jgi:hypothetical protein
VPNLSRSAHTESADISLQNELVRSTEDSPQPKIEHMDGQKGKIWSETQTQLCNGWGTAGTIPSYSVGKT